MSLSISTAFWAAGDRQHQRHAKTGGPRLVVADSSSAGGGSVDVPLPPSLSISGDASSPDDSISGDIFRDPGVHRDEPGGACYC